MSINAHLSDLTDDGLSVLTAKLMGLNEDAKLGWPLVGSLLIEHRITLSPDNETWAASFEEGEAFYAQGHASPIMAILKVFLEFKITNLQKAESSIGIRIPRNKVRSLLSEKYWENELNSIFFNTDQQLNQLNKNIKIAELKQAGEEAEQSHDADKVELYITSIY